MKKMSLFEKILVVIGVIVIIFLLCTIRKMLIIRELQNKANSYVWTENFYAKVRTYQGDNVLIGETYKFGKEHLVDIKQYSLKTGLREIINYCNGYKTDTYIDNGEEKVAIIESNGVPQGTYITNTLQTNDLWHLITASVMCNIKTENCNGKECYKLDNFYSAFVLYGDGRSTMYIDKETGLPVRLINGTITDENGEKSNIITDYVYIFDVVTQDDLKTPDLSEYKVQQK